VLVVLAVVTGLAALLVWQSLFLGRRDYMVLAGLPVQPRHVFTARFAAVAIFAAGLTDAVNILPTLSAPSETAGRWQKSALFWVNLFVPRRQTAIDRHHRQLHRDARNSRADGVGHDRGAGRFLPMFVVYCAGFLGIWWKLRTMRSEGWGETRILYEDSGSPVPDLGIRDISSRMPSSDPPWQPPLPHPAPSCAPPR
jgi:hypothetical protein